MLNKPAQRPRRERIVYLALSLMLLSLFSFKQCQNTNLKNEVGKLADQVALDEAAAQILQSQVEELEKTATITNTTTEQSPPPTREIEPGTIDLAKNRKYIRTYNDLQDLKDKYATLADSYASLEKQSNIDRQEFEQLLKDAGGEIVFEEIETIVKPPVLETVQTDSTDRYNITTTIQSNGPLVTYKQSVSVTPEIITLKSVDVQKLKAKNFLAIKSGVLYLDDFQNIYYTPAVQYGRKWWSIEGGPVMDTGFNIRGLEGKISTVIKF